MTAPLGPGVHLDLPEHVYHADPCPAPSLSASLIKIMSEKSAAHAWAEHPRLNPAGADDEDEEDAKKFDLGSAAHDLLLGQPNRFVIVDKKDWRSDDAKKAKAEAHAANRLPLLRRQWIRTEKMVAAARAQIAQIEADPDETIAWKPGKTEVTLVWQEDGIWFRMRADWLPDELLAGRHTIVPGLDYKTTRASANPEEVYRLAKGNQWHIQEALYRRGIRRVLGVDRIEFRFLVQEWARPHHALVPIALKPEWIEAGNREIERAKETWRRCMATGLWPAYPRRTCWLDAPSWMLRTSEERAARDAWAAENHTDLHALAIQWQAPAKGEAA